MKHPPRVSQNTKASIEASGENSACTGKIAYATGGEANKAVSRMRQRRNGRGSIKAYRCPFCHQYHIGHQHST